MAEFPASLNLGSLTPATGFRLDGATLNDQSGFSVSSAGDVNGDGLADLIVGALFADPNGRFGAGSSYVVFGRAPEAAVNRTGNAVANAISGGAFDDFIDGLGGNDSLFGNGGDDILRGGAGNDRLDGGAGADILRGDTGNDTYVVDDIGDIVVEQVRQGTDTVEASISYTLSDNFENLTLTGTANLTGTGNGLANIILGNDGANRLDGGAGNDTLSGGSGNDVLLGGTGNDTLSGGAGNDIYYVDNPGDVVSETDASAAGGIDTVRTTSNFGLGANVENLQFVGTGSFTGVGNALNNTITGGASDDALLGRAGNDVLRAGAGSDVLRGEEGNDGLDGGTGTDDMRGGSGNDTYYVDDAGDFVDEFEPFGGDAGGIDTVRASVSYTLGQYVENLTLTGTGSIDGTGNGLSNTLTGNAAANVLSGGEGNDILIGGTGADTLDGGAGNDRIDGGTDGDILVAGAGADRLTGGLGADTFVYRDFGDSTVEATGRDLILGFRIADGDQIDLSALDADAFTAGDQEFRFIETATFSGAAGELRAVRTGGNTQISGDVDGNRAADFSIVLQGVFELKDGSFIL